MEKSLKKNISESVCCIPETLVYTILQFKKWKNYIKKTIKHWKKLKIK